MPDITSEFLEWVELKQSKYVEFENDSLRHRKKAPSHNREHSAKPDEGPDGNLFADISLYNTFKNIASGARDLFEFEQTLDRLLRTSANAYLGLLPARQKLHLHQSSSSDGAGSDDIETFYFEAIQTTDSLDKPTHSISINKMLPMEDKQREEFDLFVTVLIKVGISCLNRLKLSTQLFLQQSDTAKGAMLKQVSSANRNFRRQIVSLIGGTSSGTSPEQIFAGKLEKQISCAHIHIESMQWLLEQTLMKVSDFHRLLKEKYVEKYLLPVSSEPSSTAGIAALPHLSGGTLPERDSRSFSERDSLEQIQSLVPTQQELMLLEQESNQMLQQLEDSVSQVRQATNQINEIATLHGQMAQHLSAQSATIEQLYNEAFSTVDNVRKANESLMSAGRHYSDSRRYTLIFFIFMTVLLLLVDRIIP